MVVEDKKEHRLTMEMNPLKHVYVCAPRQSPLDSLLHTNKKS